jgi:hypothetical protein
LTVQIARQRVIVKYALDTGQRSEMAESLLDALEAGHASIFHWDVATPWWISSFVPNLEAELGLALMFASVIPIYGRAARANLARLLAYVALLVFGVVTLAWWGFLAWLIWRVI